MLKHKEGLTALMCASNKGYTEIAQALLAAGADVNAHIDIGFTALMIAAQNGHTETLQSLLAAGADVNVHKNNGFTSLMLAAQNGHTEIAQALLAASAKIDTKTNTGSTAPILPHRNRPDTPRRRSRCQCAHKNNGFTAPMIAALNGHTGTLQALLTAGADVNAKEIDNWTALFLPHKMVTLRRYEHSSPLGRMSML